MARVAVELTNFTGGELSPRLDGRTDLTKYTSGCATLENLIVYPHGSAARRPGSTFVAEVADSDNKTRLIPFEFSTTQTYMLEFSNLKMRVFNMANSKPNIEFEVGWQLSKDIFLGVKGEAFFN